MPTALLWKMPILRSAAPFLANPHCDALTQAFGSTCVAGMRNAVLSMDDRTLELQKQYNTLVSEYQHIYGGAMVELDGKQLTIPQLGPYKESLDAKVRRSAYEAEAGYFDAHRQELDELYTKIVKNLNAQAQVLGYKDYSELSYVRMNRIGYGPEEIRRFRDQVARDVVPELQKVIELKSRRTGIQHPTFADLPIYFKDGNPNPIPGYQARMDAARKMYHELSSETAEFIDFMQDNDLFDVESRPGKMSGGYMTSLPVYKAPFIFANWNDTAADVDVLTHECGHAFEGYVAERDPKNPRRPGMSRYGERRVTTPWLWNSSPPPGMSCCLARTPPSMSCSIPRTACCSWPMAVQWMSSSTSCTRTRSTPDQRNEKWLELEHKYRPWIDFDGLPFYGRGAGWQRQLHIYECPFYYIDYCLSTMAALQFFLLNNQDHADAWQRYLRLVRRAGCASYTELCQTAGLRVPFEEGSVQAIAQQVSQWIQQNQV